ncbi:MAG: hypothetical protein IPH54_17865 [Rhodoferax sp.]|nr:hypothetical protein [Rhodoferax sp.]
MRDRQPLTAQRAVEIGFTDAWIPGDRVAFGIEVARRADAWLLSPNSFKVAVKRETRARDELIKPLAAYREELAQMRRNF